jgi:hemoglobin
MGGPAVNLGRLTCALLLALALIAGCKTASEEVKTTDNRSLYDRLGGKEALTAVIDDFLTRVANDKRISAFFAHANRARLEQLLVEQICQASGGPCTYAGKDMKTAHQGMGISSDDFDALLQDLVASLDTFKIGEREKGELLALLRPIQSEIVEK